MSDRIVSMKSFKKSFGRNSYYSMPPIEYYRRRKAGWRRSNARDYALINDTLYEIRDYDIGLGGSYVQGLPVYFEEYREWTIPIVMIRNIISIRPFVDSGDDYPYGTYRTDDLDVYVHYPNGDWFFIDLLELRPPEKVEFSSIHNRLYRVYDIGELKDSINYVATRGD